MTRNVVAFVMPIVSRRYTQNWESIGVRLNATLHSLCKQNNENWIAVVVGSELPKIHADVGNRLHWVKADIDIDDPTSMGRREIDKQRKLHNAFAYLQTVSISHVMPLDYDDLLSIRVVDRIAKLRADQGLLIKSGYVYVDGSKTMRYSRNIYKRTGSCIAVPFRPSLFPTVVSSFDPPPQGYLTYPLVRSHIKNPLTELAMFECSFEIFTGPGVVWRRSGQSVSAAFRPGADRRKYVYGPKIDWIYEMIKVPLLTRNLTRKALMEFGCDPGTFFGLDPES